MLPPVTIPVSVADVPFYSQFRDIDSLQWRNKSCGIASLAMVIEFYKPDTVSINKLLLEGIASGAYNESAGWTYAGLIKIAHKYGLDGTSYDFGTSDSATAFSQFKSYLKNGPVIVSIHYKFDPKSNVPHLVVIDGIDNDFVYYNDPAGKFAENKISVSDFLKGWKKRFIVLAPSIENA